MEKRNIFNTALVIVVALVFLAGCGTVPKKKYEQDVKGITSRMESLESKVEGMEAKQTETERMVAEQQRPAEESAGPKTNVAVMERNPKGHARTKEIQECLASAGFYKGKVDGVKGKKTRKAIKEFQRANGLTPDGVVGKKTWELLSKYAQGSAGKDESVK